MASTVEGPVAPAGSIPLAVLGDSNSHSYQDRQTFPAGSPARGGALQASTFQWTEVLARLRPNEIDQGPWGVWGQRARVLVLRETLGLPVEQWPKKEDYRYNLAFTGSNCADLLSSRQQQAQRLVELMDLDRERWKRGVVVIRMGTNDWKPVLDQQARDPSALEVQAARTRCADAIGGTVALIRAAHPSTRILLVGISNEADDPAFHARWQSAAESANIDKALDGFNAAIRDIAKHHPNVAFFDDQAWSKSRWGSRDPAGKPAFKTLVIGSLRVTNTAGDTPNNALLADSHYGLVANALWAQSLVARLNEAFGLKLTPISDAEVLRFLETAIGTPKARAPGS
ncbi:SGNH/GDSL hydrolase family protein [Variovorax ginsengisoli]|uniref:SGNH/GDSL hydrolase family protein n=1 Tax=Variovorax ginsengisoli TaxID=363844 RepID=A0ABT8SAL3_9BURK|nr:SGNH/GDSL hydrolase family protein [Variovorax ginsengisoli]MDN8616792.1 SGNH/GDSL hydrolase family protein [Variovorax ginsengisoli]MDO1535962.1 SGNH/GDSL hydrolase family protein [Variovorax ginsengisoli]